MWTFKLALTSLWMAGVVRGWTFHGSWHLLAAAVVFLVFAEGTAIERRIARIALALCEALHLRRSSTARPALASR